MAGTALGPGGAGVDKGDVVSASQSSQGGRKAGCETSEDTHKLAREPLFKSYKKLGPNEGEFKPDRLHRISFLSPSRSQMSTRVFSVSVSPAPPDLSGAKCREYPHRTGVVGLGCTQLQLWGLTEELSAPCRC